MADDLVERLEERAKLMSALAFSNTYAQKTGNLLREAAADLASRPQAVSQGWRPIETAPKDGTVILAYRPGEGVFTAHFIAADVALGLCHPNVSEVEPQWWSTDGGDLSSPGMMPTHWMPLPEAPK